MYYFGENYVDPVINQTVFSQIDLREHIAQLLRFEFPERFLPTFLHETTHHWCFNSPVGTALALLRMRACRRATMVSSGYNDFDLHWDLLEDVLRQETAQKLLRPYAEGLACFMELDSIPGSSNVISMPSLLAFLNFNNYEDDKCLRSDINLQIYSLLYRARQDPPLTQRREDLLASHFNPKHGGHLAGYMIVKGLWRQGKCQSNRAYDAELFVCFLRAFFWHDYGLVNILLDPTLSEHNAVNAISDYFVNRLNQLLEIDWEKQLEIFEVSYLESSSVKKMAGATPIQHWKFDGLGISEELWQSGSTRLDCLIEELYSDIEHIFEPENPKWLQAMLNVFDRERFLRRDLLCIGSLDVEVEINEYGRVLAYHGVGGEEIPVFAGTHSLPIQCSLERARGSIDFFLLPRWHARALCVLRENICVCEIFQGNLTDEVKQHIKEIVATRSASSRIVADAEKNLAKVISGDAIHIIYKKFHETSDPELESLALNMILSLVGTPVSNEFRLKLKNTGMFGVFDEDAELLSGLAFLGVACSVCADRDTIRNLALQQGIDLDKVIHGIKTIESETGFPILIEKDNKLFCLL